MTENEQYEITARAFEIITGELAPGKDVPMLGRGRSFGERSGMFQMFLQYQGDAVRAVIQAVEENE